MDPKNPLGLSPVKPEDLGQDPYCCGECAELPPDDRVVEVHACQALGIAVYRCDQRADNSIKFRYRHD